MMLGTFKELYSYRSMIFNLVKRDLRGRYKGSILGFIWNFVLPLMQIIVYIMVFTIVFRQNIEHYYVYLIVGMIPWTMFSESLSAGSGSIVENSQLVSKIYFPRAVIPLSIVMSKFVNFLISMVFVFIVLAADHGFEVIPVLFTPVAVVFLFLFSLGFAMLTAAADVYMRDIQYLVSVLLMICIWITPIMFTSIYIDNELFKMILDLNPMTYIVGMFQDALYWKELPGIKELVCALCISVGMFIVGFGVFNKYSADFAEVL